MKTCARCGHAKLVASFSRRAAASDGLHAWCKPCHLAYKQERRPPRAPIPDAPPDPRPVVMLRMELERLRAQDCGFGLAWSGALTLALESLPAQQRREWRRVLAEHRSIWKAAYFGMPVAAEPFGVLRTFGDEAELWSPPHARTAPAGGTREDPATTSAPARPLSATNAS
jgi:hypothetical protein